MRPDLHGSLDALRWSGLIISDRPSITDTLTHPTITDETSPHFAEALGGAPEGAGKASILAALSVAAGRQVLLQRVLASRQQQGEKEPQLNGTSTLHRSPGSSADRATAS
jgi:hypothetical protein